MWMSSQAWFLRFALFSGVAMSELPAELALSLGGGAPLAVLVGRRLPLDLGVDLLELLVEVRDDLLQVRDRPALGVDLVGRLAGDLRLLDHFVLDVDVGGGVWWGPRGAAG